MKFSSELWGPSFWFILHSITFKYPQFPTNNIKKKYYEFIQNLPQFMPDEKIGNEFAKFLDKYPVTPYLDNRNSFIRWMHFIHNRINVHLKKEIMSFSDFLKKYETIYSQDNLTQTRNKLIKQYIVYLVTVIFLLISCYMLYRK
uniref:thiol oxidase n=1 Tax=viral metagenome TaxID=1070528 RepID=A0A6C0AWR3_9ZZZZ|tara:strand:+ start:4506 stop:4937 length:432 start_codon:yes stop_codon:yes gene_type:complete